jgi:hypothetical protein
MMEIGRQRTAGGVPGIVSYSSNLQCQVLNNEPLAWRQIFKTAILGWGLLAIDIVFFMWLRHGFFPASSLVLPGRA